MKTIEDMTAQIRKMDATGKSNTMLISKLKKKLGTFYHDINIRPSIIITLICTQLINKYFYISDKLEWKGPTSKIWSDVQCHHLQILDSSHNVARCMQACRLRQGCTAFNYNKNGGCTLRECSGSVPVPAWKLPGWEGYHLKRGT